VVMRWGRECGVSEEKASTLLALNKKAVAD
jgi:hypothetical protein